MGSMGIVVVADNSPLFGASLPVSLSRKGGGFSDISFKKPVCWEVRDPI